MGIVHNQTIYSYKICSFYISEVGTFTYFLVSLYLYLKLAVIKHHSAVVNNSPHNYGDYYLQYQIYKSAVKICLHTKSQDSCNFQCFPVRQIM